MTTLLFHGLSATIADLSELHGLLTRRGDSAHLVPLPGHGPLAEPPIAKVYAQDYLRCAEYAFETALRNDPGPQRVVGLSFGALLALYLAERYSASISHLVLLSPPIIHRSFVRPLVLSVLSPLPEPILSRLPTIKKSARAEGTFIRKREAFPSHHVGSVVRMEQIKARALRGAGLVTAKVLIGQDSHDHYLKPTGVTVLRERLTNAKQIDLRWFPGGQHELTCGPHVEAVHREILSFLDSGSAMPGIEKTVHSGER